MARDLLNLSRRMHKLARAVDEDVNEFVKNVSLSIHAEEVERTPVDVGTARSNWVLRVGRPFSYVYKAFFPGKHLGRGEASNLLGALRQARAAVSSRKNDQPVYITNNVPYIGRLNRGHSRQSPAGFVQAGVSSGVGRGVRLFKFNNVRRLY